MTGLAQLPLRQRWLAASAVILLCGFPTGLSADDGSPTRLFVRDAWTGLAVPGAQAQAGATGTPRLEAAREASAVGHLSFPVGIDGERLEIRAPGYRTMLVPAFAPDRESPTTAVWLIPRERAEELRPEKIAERRLPATTMLHGHVVDPGSGRPVAGATVTVDGTDRRTATNERGYFLLYTKGTKVLSPADVPEFADLVVAAPGHATARLRHIALLEDDFHFIVDLPAGTGEISRDLSHKLYPIGYEDHLEGWVGHGEEEEAGAIDAAPAAAFAAAPGGLEHATLAATPGGLQVINPPDNINVSGFGLVPLEVYLARGLCAEWISSWGAHSLAAGAIAYRSYGSWYQINNGSICTTTSCQVYNNTYNANCDAAAQRTTGILLQRLGAVARSEYSAENNSLVCGGFSCVNVDLSCGNGSAGSPSASWSCLADSHLFDQGPGTCCFGHGRGMCQWGTHAWSRGGQLWNWITDRYYNNFGTGTGLRTMFMTSPFDIVSATFPGAAGRGTTFTINETLRSYTDWSQSQIMLGASLTGPATVSDAARDKKVTVLARTSFAVQSRDTAVSRQFAVPPGIPVGTYNLIVAIWFDTNGNNLIDAADKPLRTLTYPSAIVIN